MFKQSSSILKLPDGTVKVLVEGVERVKILVNQEKDEDYLFCDVEFHKDTNNSKDSDTYALSLVKRFEKLMFLNKRDFSDNLESIKKLKDISQIANNIAANLNFRIFQKQELLKLKT